MNNEQTLLELGFIRYPEWDFESTGIEHYRLDKDGVIFRAYVQHYNPPVYVTMGVVVNDIGIVDKWRDCVSENSVKRKIENYLKK